MTRCLRAVARLCAGEEAATLVEYTLVMMLVAAACVAALGTFATALSGLLTRAINVFPR